MTRLVNVPFFFLATGEEKMKGGEYERLWGTTVLLGGLSGFIARMAGEVKQIGGC
jgi:hypothetical protein